MARRPWVWGCLAEYVLLMDTEHQWSVFNLKIGANQHPVERYVLLSQVQTFLLYSRSLNLSYFIITAAVELQLCYTLLRSCMPVNLSRLVWSCLFCMHSVYAPICLCSTPSGRCLQRRSEHLFPPTPKNGKSPEASCENMLEEFWTDETARSVDIKSTKQMAAQTAKCSYGNQTVDAELLFQRSLLIPS